MVLRIKFHLNSANNVKFKLDKKDRKVAMNMHSWRCYCYPDTFNTDTFCHDIVDNLYLLYSLKINRLNLLSTLHYFTHLWHNFEIAMRALLAAKKDIFRINNNCWYAQIFKTHTHLKFTIYKMDIENIDYVIFHTIRANCLPKMIPFQFE